MKAATAHAEASLMSLSHPYCMAAHLLSAPSIIAPLVGLTEAVTQSLLASADVLDLLWVISGIQMRPFINVLDFPTGAHLLCRCRKQWYSLRKANSASIEICC